MDNQTLINTAILLIGGMGGWIMNGMRDSIKMLHDSDKEITTKLQAIELLVAGTYVKRDDFDKLGQALFTKLDKIDGKLDAKADKDACSQFHRGAP